MNVFLLGLQVGETLRWIIANWVAIFSMLAMVAFVGLLVVLALAPDARTDSDSSEASSRTQGRDRGSTKIEQEDL